MKAVFSASKCLQTVIRKVNLKTMEDAMEIWVLDCDGQPVINGQVRHPRTGEWYDVTKDWIVYRNN